VLSISFFAGLIGALTGLGGGVVLIPVMVLLLHVDIHYAIGASLVSVMVTSSGAAAAFLREKITNLRIGMFLETGAITGAFVGAILVPYVSIQFLAILFACILFLSAYLTLRRKEDLETTKESHHWAIKLKLASTFPSKSGNKEYSVQKVPYALFIMTIAGIFSGLLGIGSGALKVLAMDQAMRIPYKVATATSNFMIGITAAVSIGVYLKHGYIDPGITFPVMIGVALGAFLGAKILIKARSQSLRIIFSIIICLLGFEMLYKAVIGAL
jgi:hypothetical protein